MRRLADAAAFLRWNETSLEIFFIREHRADKIWNKTLLLKRDCGKTGMDPADNSFSYCERLNCYW